MMGKIRKFVIVMFSIYAWTLGYALATLLKTCEGENLEDCVNKAESLLQDPDMTFPDDNKTLDRMCRMWEEMTGCTYNYTEKCLSVKENMEFHQYFQEPISSMKTVCTDRQSTEDYLRHAHCIKKISTGKNFCAIQYKIMIDQIISVTINTMRRICCALADFKECVMQANINDVCGFEGPGGASIASYALRTLEKSLLAFVAHSCAKEGYHQERCREDEEPPNELSHLKEARWDFPFGNNSELQYTIAGSELDNTMTKTRKPLLVPIHSILNEDTFPDKVRANVSHLGERGLQIPRLGKNIHSKSTDGKYPHPTQTSTATNLHSTIIRNSSLDSLGKPPQSNDQMSLPQFNNNSSTMNPMDINNKFRNLSASTWLSNLTPPSRGNISKNPMAEKRIDITSSSSKGKDLNEGNKILKDSSPPSSSFFTFNSTGITKISGKFPPEPKNDSQTLLVVSTRTNGGRSLNFIESSVQSGLATSDPTSKNSDTSQKPLKETTPPYSPPLTTTSTSTSQSPRPPNTTTITSTTTSTTKNTTTTTLTSTSTTTSTTTTKMTTRATREPRIMNIPPNSNSLAILNQALGLAPPSTAPPVSKNGHGKSKRKPPLSINNTTKAEESKNSGNFSVSDVPIRVFMVWLSTFFV